MYIVLLTAGGSGTRMGQDIPKQLMNIDDCPVIIEYANRGTHGCNSMFSGADCFCVTR